MFHRAYNPSRYIVAPLQHVSLASRLLNSPETFFGGPR